MNNAKRDKILGLILILAFGFGAWNNFRGEGIESSAAGYISLILVAVGIHRLIKGFRAKSQ